MRGTRRGNQGGGRGRGREGRQSKGKTNGKGNGKGKGEEREWKKVLFGGLDCAPGKFYSFFFSLGFPPFFFPFLLAFGGYVF